MSAGATGLLAAAIPGREIRRGRRFRELAGNIPQAWKFWRGQGRDWAAFVVGDALSRLDIAGIAKARTAQVAPVIVAPSHRAVKATSHRYRELDAFVVCEIAGRGCLIAPPIPPHAPPNLPAPSTTRVPARLLEQLAQGNQLEPALGRRISELHDSYRRLCRRGNHDDREGKLLLNYAKATLDAMGLDAARLEAASMVRTLENANLGQGRDHFFHSFQNYFLGLLAVTRFPAAFNRYQGEGNLHWRVEPCNVWFLTALWHDVGYSLQNLGNVVDVTLGPDPEDDADDNYWRDKFLGRVSTQEGLRQVSSLMAHLLYPTTPPTDWMPPASPNTNLGPEAEKIRMALIKNISESHGAFGGLRLYCDYKNDLDRMNPGPQKVLRQTVLLASCSMPFHDLHFRASLRDICGRCRLPTTVFPFATLLAFIDSLQDDQRSLEGVKTELRVLEGLLLAPPATISAQVERDSLADPHFLPKIIEARDVLASFHQTRRHLYFKYPQWVTIHR